MTAEAREVWLRGPVAGVQPLLQPVAHTLLQAEEEVADILADFPEHLLWARPAGVASVGFHLQHLAGVLERLFTYARGDALNEDQFTALAAEGKPEADITLQTLHQAFQTQVRVAVATLRAHSGATLLAARKVGRAGLPSTEWGLLFHAAEHTQRHVGQLLVTVRMLTEADAART